MGSYEQGMGNHPPDRLYAMDERHLLVEIPLDEDQAPEPQPIRINGEFTDDEDRKTYQWCLRFAGDRGGDPQQWTLVVLDCLSLYPTGSR